MASFFPLDLLHAHTVPARMGLISDGAFVHALRALHVMQSATRLNDLRPPIALASTARRVEGSCVT
jgi:hypothetical protein